MSLWEEKTILSSGLSLKVEYERAAKITQPPNDSGTLSDEQQAAFRTLQENIHGRLAAEELPEDLSWQMLLKKTGIAPHLFFDDNLYTARERGAILAEQIISGRLDFVRRVADELDRNRREAAQKRKQKKTKEHQSQTRRGKARTKRPPRTRSGQARVKRR